MKNKIIWWMFVLIVSSLSVMCVAADVSVETLSSKYSSCNASETKNASYYLEEWKTVKSYPADAYFSTHTFGVLPTSKSKVQIWKNGVINNCWKWSWDSNYIPASNASNKYIIFQNYDGCEFKKPSTTKENDRDRIDAQIHYYIAYKHLMPNGTEKASLWWFYKKNGESAYRCENWTLTTSPWSCAKTEKKFDPETHTHVWECINYRIYWCWDWVLNGRNWSTSYENGTYTEKCDPKDPNKEWWWEMWCSSSCEPLSLPDPVCWDGTVNWTEKCDPKDPNKEWWWEMWCSTSCEPLDAVCWDWTKSKSEKCDPKDTSKEWWWEMWCSTSCEPLDAVCWDWTKSKSEKCDPKDPNKEWWWEGWCSTSCEPLSLPDPKCWDWTLNWTEKCDPKDTSKEWWWEMWCSTSCEPLDAVCWDGTKSKSEKCDPKDPNKEWWWEKGCSSSCEPIDKTIIPVISKKVVGSTTWYHKWDLITFRINFKNDKDKRIDGIVIKDFLPLNVEYKSSEIYWISPKPTLTDYSIYEDQKILDHDFKKGQKVVETSSFSLDPWKSGYILLTWEVLWSNTDNRINVACEYVDTTVVCTNWVQYDLGWRSFKAEKKVEWTKKKFSIWDSFTYNIHVKSVEWEYEKLVIRDKLPKWLKFVSWTEELDWINVKLHNPKERTDWWETVVRTLEFPNGFKTYNWKSDSFDLKITVKISWDDAKYTNIAYVCKDEYQKDEDCEEIKSDDVDVSDDWALTIKKYVGRSADINSSWADDLMKFNTWDTVYFKIVVTASDWKIKDFLVEDPLSSAVDFISFESSTIIGDGIVSSDYIIEEDDDWGNLKWSITMNDGAYFEKWDRLVIVFSVKMNDETTNVAKAIYKWKEVNDDASISGPTPPPDPDLKCWDGKQNAGIEFCDLEGEKTVKNWELFSKGGEKNTNYNWWTCTKDCQLVSPNKQMPSCSNINDWSISIMEWEMLPFYWNIQWMLWSRDVDAKKAYLKENFFVGPTCNEDDYSKAKIDLDTMMCRFVVYGPNKEVGKKGYDNPVYSFEIPCLKTNWWWAWGYASTEYYDAIKDFINQNENWWFDWSVWYNWNSDAAKNVFETLDNWYDYPSLFPRSSKVIITNFGKEWSTVIWNNIQNLIINPILYYWEYAVALDAIEFRRCAWKWRDPDEGDQFGVSNESQSLKQICAVNFALTDHYFVQKSPYWAINENSKKSLSNYRQKNWTQLFKMVDSDEKDTDYWVEQQVFDNYKTFITKYSKIAKPFSSSDRIRKVAWKDLYLIDWNEEFLLPSSELNLNSSFTLIATSGADIRVTNNIYVNMMLITEWRIIFDAINACNPDREWWVVKYWKAGQMVQGIFYAWSWYLSINDTYNERNSVTNKPKYKNWCNYGNLHIKWVVVGKNLDNVIQKRRSELYTWFWAWSDSKKREVVLNWASVQVEYNPNLLWELPPWAEEFNKLLKTQRE